MPHHESRAQGEDNMLIVGMEDQSFVDLAYGKKHNYVKEQIVCLP